MAPNAMRRQTGVTRQLQAPTGGLNARDSIAAMPVGDAIAMDNVFPERSWVELRRGFASHATGITGPTESLLVWSSATQRMFAVAGGNVFNVSSAGAVGSAVVTGLANSRFQSVMFTNTGGTYLVAVNGADGVRTYDGTTWATQTITEGGAPFAGSAAFGSVTTWMKRLWFGRNGTSKAYYLATDAIMGDATVLDLGGVWRLGGNIASILSTSFDAAGTGLSEYIGFVSTLGEIAIYRGTDPASATTFERVGTYRLSTPVGRRFFAQMGGDMALITSEGVLSLMQAMQIDRSTAVKFSVTDKINRLFSEAYIEFGSTFGWDLIVYPRGHRLIVNVPQGTEASIQYVMNTLSGAWCRYTGHNALCWALFNDEIYFAGAAGTVFKADVGADDNGAAIPWVMRPAFNDFGTRMQKRFTLVRPLITANGAPSLSIVMDLDYGAQNMTNIPLTVSNSAVWDTAVWDVSQWAGGMDIYRPLTSVGGVGYVGSVRMAGSSKGVTMQINAMDVVFEPATRLTT